MKVENYYPLLGIIFSILSATRQPHLSKLKINERIALMQEQNNLLRKLISGSISQERVESDTIIDKPVEKPAVEFITHTAPKIVSKSKTNESSLIFFSHHLSNLMCESLRHYLDVF